MSTKTQLAVMESRISYWADLLSRKPSSGMDVESFCIDSGITKNQYYYWLRKVREAAVDLPGSPFVELKTSQYQSSMISSGNAELSISIADATILVHENASEHLLMNVIRAIRNA